VTRPVAPARPSCWPCSTIAPTATSILARYFDLTVSPHVEVQFQTFVNAYDLNRGHVIEFASDWDGVIAYPGLGGDGSWANKAFRVTNLKRLRGLPPRYAVACEEV